MYLYVPDLLLLSRSTEQRCYEFASAVTTAPSTGNKDALDVLQEIMNAIDKCRDQPYLLPPTSQKFMDLVTKEVGIATDLGEAERSFLRTTQSTSALGLLGLGQISQESTIQRIASIKLIYSTFYDIIKEAVSAARAMHQSSATMELDMIKTRLENLRPFETAAPGVCAIYHVSNIPISSLTAGFQMEIRSLALLATMVGITRTLNTGNLRRLIELQDAVVPAFQRYFDSFLNEPNRLAPENINEAMVHVMRDQALLVGYCDPDNGDQAPNVFLDQVIPAYPTDICITLACLFDALKSVYVSTDDSNLHDVVAALESPTRAFQDWIAANTPRTGDIWNRLRQENSTGVYMVILEEIRKTKHSRVVVQSGLTKTQNQAQSNKAKLVVVRNINQFHAPKPRQTPGGAAHAAEDKGNRTDGCHSV